MICTPKEFLEMARTVVELHPQSTHKLKRCYLVATPVHSVRIYEDDILKIQKDTETPTLEVTRVENNNPTTMVAEDGNLIRHHGEHGHLVEHLKKLYQECKTR